MLANAMQLAVFDGLVVQRARDVAEGRLHEWKDRFEALVAAIWPEQAVQLDVLAKFPAGVVFDYVVQQHSAAEAVEDSGGDRADLAGADHAGGAAVQVESKQTIQGKIALARGCRICEVGG